MHYYFVNILLINFFYSTNGLTEIVSTTDCFSIPENPLSILGVRIISGKENGKKMCYYGPKTNEYYFSILINNLNLDKINSICPKLRLEAYQSVRVELEMVNEIQLKWQVPENPKLIFEADCTNYKSKIKTVIETTQPGDKVMLIYDPGNEAAPEDAYYLTLSSYVLGQSYSCPNVKYRCWNSNFKCIDESLVCDNVDNCYDNSDENDYKCTGRIGDMPMPLFIIIIIAAILLLIFIIMVIILIMRNRKSKKEHKRQLLAGVDDHHYEDEVMPSRSYMS